jgi:DNA mismatch endonuclease (patch repair protein)
MTVEQRSRHMARIRGDSLKPELTFNLALRRLGLRPGRNVKGYPGTPDFLWPRKKVAVFVDGCYWHGCPEHGSVPRTRVEFWTSKFEDNKARDRRNSRQLRASGFRVCRVWECVAMRLTDWAASAVQGVVDGCRNCRGDLRWAYKRPERTLRDALSMPICGPDSRRTIDKSDRRSHSRSSK